MSSGIDFIVHSASSGRMLREVDRQLVGIERLLYQSFIDVAYRVLAQQKKDSHKILSLHEPHVYCISKGKDWRKYEYGSKVNVFSGRLQSEYTIVKRTYMTAKR